MPFGPFGLQWRTPSPNPPSPSPPPSGITRSYITTPSGPLELLSAIPSTPTSSSQPPIFFAHGGFGCASVWLSYLQFFASRGIPCYAISYRGHGGSWYPSLLRMYIAPMSVMAGDLVAGVKAVEEMETERREKEGGKVQERVRVVLVAHSAGGAMSQYVLSKGLVRAQGFCMCAAVPGFGSFSVYKFWSLSAPFHFPYRLFHPRCILATTQQVKDAFFTSSTPTRVVQALERILSPYESMLWPMQTLFRFVRGGDVLSSITGWGLRNPSTSSKSRPKSESVISQRLLVLAAENDVLCRPDILLDAARQYRSAFQELVRQGKIDGVSIKDLRTEREQGEVWGGVGFRVVKGLGHHLQNHEGWETGAEEILEWVRGL